MAEELIKLKKLVVRTEVVFQEEQELAVLEAVQELLGGFLEMTRGTEILVSGEREMFVMRSDLEDFVSPETVEEPPAWRGDTDLPMELSVWLQGYHGIGNGLAQKVMDQFTEDKVIWGLAQMDPDNISEEFQARISPERGAQLPLSTIRRMIEDAQALVSGEKTYEPA